MSGGERRDGDIEQLGGSESGERTGGGLDGDVSQWYRVVVNWRWVCVS